MTVQRCTGEGDEKCGCVVTRAEHNWFYSFDKPNGGKGFRCAHCDHSVGCHPQGTSFALSLSRTAVIDCECVAALGITQFVAAAPLQTAAPAQVR
jgi:hypothetical protein